MAQGLKERWRPGQHAWFEYHCEQSHQSCDAELWYRSHQQVLVVGVDETGIGETFADRLEHGALRVYRIQFDDGYEDSAYEDELFVSPNYWDPDYGPP